MASKINAGNVTRKDMLMVDPNQIVVKEDLRGRWQAPAEQAIINMAESMMENSQLEPVQCRKIEDDKLLLTLGFTRTAAARLIVDGFTNSDGVDVKDPDFKIKVILVSGNEDSAFIANVVENAIRNETSHVDNAFNQNKLREQHGMTNDAIAKLYKWKDTVKVSKLQRLLNAETAILQQVHDGALGLEGALLLLDLPEDKRAEAIATATTENGKVNGAAIKTQVRDHHLRDENADNKGGVIPPKKHNAISMKELREYFAEEQETYSENSEVAKYLETFLQFVNGTRSKATLKKVFKTVVSK